MNKKYYDGGIVTEILFTHLEPEKMFEVLTAFAEVKGVDAVEVVRCKECKWGKETCGNIECNSEYHGYDWFCPNGERKEQ